MSDFRSKLEVRPAVEGDAVAIRALMERSIDALQVGFLTAEQIKASHNAMGLDTQLIADATYFCVFDGDTLVGCGGWSFRATLYGGNHTQGRNGRVLVPATERARIRAMYTHPDHTKRGIGRLVLAAAETAAAEAGFNALEMAATLAGEPFYLKCGYKVESRWIDTNGEVDIPLLTMVKTL